MARRCRLHVWLISFVQHQRARLDGLSLSAQSSDRGTCTVMTRLLVLISGFGVVFGLVHTTLVIWFQVVSGGFMMF
jgi:hypothetical protein